MGFSFTPVWKEAPFVRLVIPLIAGIMIRSFLPLQKEILWAGYIFSLAVLLAVPMLKISLQFKYSFVHGIHVNILFICAGALIISYNDTSENKSAVTAARSARSLVVAVLKEPPVQREKTFRARCTIESIQKENHEIVKIKTDLILYFRKDSTASPPGYGDRIAFIKPLEPIKNIPVAPDFDYINYCARQNIYFQAFLNTREYIRLAGKSTHWLPSFLLHIQQFVLTALQRNIHGKRECGLAEALLIGYKNNLDRQLMQSYSNTGVIHVVAISGLHLGLIYALIKQFCAPLKNKKRWGKWLTAIIVIAGLWIFSLLAGGSPSVLRSAVMFSFIVAGEAANRKTSLFNNLAASAFFLLCYDPYWFWDIGFQLSYTALLSIAIFMKPVYHLFTIKNRLLDSAWQLNATTIAAQILTAPVCIYYFHQFPTLFLITNFFAVPLSSAILIGEIMLCAFSFTRFIAVPLGWLLNKLLAWMNDIVELLGSFSFSSITGIKINVLQLIFLYLAIAGLSSWLIAGKRRGLPFALISAILFMAINLI